MASVPSAPAMRTHGKPSKDNIQKHKKGMDKLKEAVLKLVATDPNPPLPSTQMAVLQDRLTHIFSQFRTPNHPPYAAMIQRALQELNQRGGSSEESISQFIKREYNDLPWAHCTLLKHHLGLLCNSGEVVETRGLRYSLPGATSQRKNRKKKRGNWEKRQSKRRKTENGKLHIEDGIGSTEELKRVDDQQNPAPQEKVNKRENVQINEIKQLKQDRAVSVDLLQSSVGVQSSSESSLLTVEPPLPTQGCKCDAEFVVQQEKCEPRNAQMVEFCDPHAEQPEETDYEVDIFDPLCLGFEFLSLENSSNTQQVEHGDHQAPSHLGDSLETCGEKSLVPSESTSKTDCPPPENHKQEKSGDGAKSSSAKNTEIVGLTGPKEKQQLENKSQHHAQELLGQDLKQETAVLALPYQQKEHLLVEIVQIKETPPLLENSSKCRQLKNKQYYRKKRTRSQKKETRKDEVTVKESQTLETKEQDKACTTQKGPKLQPSTTRASSRTEKDPKQLNQNFELVLSDTAKVLGHDSLGLQDSPQTKRMQRQLRRWSGKLPDPRPSTALMASSESSVINYGPDMEKLKPQEHKQMSTECPQPCSAERAKLRSWQKQNGTQPQAISVSPCSSVDMQQKNRAHNHRCVNQCPEPEVGENFVLGRQKNQPQKRYQRRGRPSRKGKMDIVMVNES